MKEQINIGLVGFGTIGSGTMQLLKQHKADVEARVGAKVEVKWVCDLLSKKSPWIDKKVRRTKNWAEVISDPEVDLIIELVGGISPAKEIITSALESGKHVVTANKAILSKFWDEIFDIAYRRRKLVYFEASVGGGVPVIQALNEGLAGNKINRIVGILNGTSNFILTKMDAEGISFKDAVKAAQKAGFAERNPSFDVNGTDSAQKISILTSLAIGQWVSPDMVYTEGITQLQALDLKLIKERLNSTIKLLAISENTPNGWILRVHPTLVSKSHPFANVRNEYNAVSLYGNAVQDIILYGKGAGRLPTASAVLSDIIFLARHIVMGTAGKLPYVTRRDHAKFKLASMSKVRSCYYIRVNTADKPGVLSKVTGVLGRNKVSIASVHQDLVPEKQSAKKVPIILITHDSEEARVQASVKAIDRLPTTSGKTVLLRME